MEKGLLPGFSQQPYWLDQIGPAPALPEQPLQNADVVIVGSGYTGLNAALVTARAGRSTLVLDSGDPGFGCSTRNGGQISTSVKPSLEKLTGKYGVEKARAIRQEGEKALQWIQDLIQAENIECDFKRSGRYHAAHTPQHYEDLARDAQMLRRDENTDVHVVPRDTQLSELGSDSYYGGVVFARHASLHPAKFHRGLLQRVVDAGAHVTGHCAVSHIERTATGFTVTTEKGQVTARDVIVATNGYTTNLTPWLQRRVIPIGSNIIATEPLPEPLVDRLFPTDRIASDTCKVVYYYRASPDRRRILFGGRVSAREIGADAGGAKLYQSMCRIFPELRDYGVTHSWSGTVAYTFDELAHTGVHDGVHYAMGYCGSGVSMAGYLGMRLGQKVLGLKDGQTAFDGLNNPTRPLYTGTPWFLPAAVAWYQWNDRRQIRKAAQMA
ncbi:MAG: glycine/D-amino acid oxidase-like deaminating enzyme [Paracoccaceae bacterium]|jgi:glycine/D-amino acid oxidase-like deaminating enzyme